MQRVKCPECGGQNADDVEALGHPAFANGMRWVAEQIAAELRRRGYRI